MATPPRCGYGSGSLSAPPLDPRASARARARQARLTASDRCAPQGKKKRDKTCADVPPRALVRPDGSSRSAPRACDAAAPHAAAQGHGSGAEEVAGSDVELEVCATTCASFLPL
jgi:hypothetical protein